MAYMSCWFAICVNKQLLNRVIFEALLKQVDFQMWENYFFNHMDRRSLQTPREVPQLLTPLEWIMQAYISKFTFQALSEFRDTGNSNSSDITYLKIKKKQRSPDTSLRRVYFSFSSGRWKIIKVSRGGEETR